MNLEDSAPEPGCSTPKPEKDPKPAPPRSSPTQSSQRSTSRGGTGQGRRPSSPPAREKTIDQAGGPEDEPQSYQTFKLQFLLDERNTVRRTEITHVETGKPRILTGYDREGILAVLEAYVRPAAERDSVAELDSRESAEPAEAVDKPPAADVGGGKVSAEALEAATVSFHSPPSTLEVGEPATFRLTINFGSARAPGEMAPDYQYRALISAKPLYGGPWQKVGTSSGSLTGLATTMIEVPVAPQPRQGLYQLEGTISLRDPVSGRPYRLLRVGGASLLQVNTVSTMGVQT